MDKCHSRISLLPASSETPFMNVMGGAANFVMKKSSNMVHFPRLTLRREQFTISFPVRVGGGRHQILADASVLPVIPRRGRVELWRGLNLSRLFATIRSC